MPASAARGERAQEARPGGCGRGRHALGEAHCRVALVAGERFVAAVADESDGDLAPRRFADEEKR